MSEIQPSMGGLRTCGTALTTGCSLYPLADFCIIWGFFSRQKIHKSLVSGRIWGWKAW